MKVLITGGAGFLGQNLAKALLAKDHTVRLLVRGDQAKKSVAHLKVETVHGDLGDEASLEVACEGQEILFHTAGVISYNPQKNDLMYRTNVLGTKNIAQAALRAGIKRMIHTSSTAAIGVNTDPSALMDENSPFNARKLKLAYFDTKYDAEQELLNFVGKGLDAVIINPGSLMGPGDTRRYEQTYPGLIYKYKPPFLMHGGINYVDVNDVVQGHLLAMEKGRKGERYILGGENLSFAQLIQRTNMIIGRKSPKFYLPRSAMGTVSKILKLAQVMGLHLHMTPELVQQMSSWYLFVDSSKAKRELGYNPRSIDDAIRGTISWLKEIGRI